MPPLTPAQLHQASRNRRVRQGPRVRRRWLLPLVVVVSLIGFLAATVPFAMQSRQASGCRSAT